MGHDRESRQGSVSKSSKEGIAARQIVSAIFGPVPKSLRFHDIARLAQVQDSLPLEP